METHKLNTLLIELEVQFDQDALTMPAELAASATSVRRRVGFGKNPDSRWSRRFTPLVLFYPLLQLEGTAELEPRARKPALLSHLYFLVFSVLDDRRRDAQVDLGSAETQYTGWCFDRGLELASSLGPSVDFRCLVEEMASRYELGNSAAGKSPAASRDRPDPAVVGRSIWGALVPVVLLLERTDRSEYVIQSIRAFEWLIYGIQWADDIEDWSDDMLTGDDNLLLRDVREHKHRTPQRGGTYARHILDSRAIQNGVQRARQAFTEAESIQASLGCKTLARMIHERSRNLLQVQELALKSCEVCSFL